MGDIQQSPCLSTGLYHCFRCLTVYFPDPSTGSRWQWRSSESNKYQPKYILKMENHPKKKTIHQPRITRASKNYYPRKEPPLWVTCSLNFSIWKKHVGRRFYKKTSEVLCRSLETNPQPWAFPIQGGVSPKLTAGNIPRYPGLASKSKSSRVFQSTLMIRAVWCAMAHDVTISFFTRSRDFDSILYSLFWRCDDLFSKMIPNASMDGSFLSIPPGNDRSQIPLEVRNNHQSTQQCFF